MEDIWDLRKKIRENISYPNRLLISHILFVFLILLFYFGVFLGILISILFRSLTFFLTLYIVFFIIFISYRLFIPSKFESVTYDLKKLAENLEANPFKKQRLFRILIHDMRRIVRSKSDGY